MRTFHISLFLIILIINFGYSQNTSIKDNRDEKVYKIVELGGLYWMQGT